MSDFRDWTRQIDSRGICIYVLGLEYKYFLVVTIVRRGVGVEVSVEIHVESFYAETPDCELQRGQQAIFFLPQH